MRMNNDFGSLERVSARQGWQTEDRDFTPWLAHHLDGLSDAIGLHLELVDREHSVGRYSLDLLLEDSRARVVVAENQFGQTDHTHLGQLLTYCAGTDAQVLIWLAERFTDEHAAALEWLNENSVEDVGFFGIELELLKIDESRLAPDFRVRVRPNAWTKAARRQTRRSGQHSWEEYEQSGMSASKITIGRALVDAILAEARKQELEWKAMFNKGYVAIQRSGGYNVLTVSLEAVRIPRLAVNLPSSPQDLDPPNLYPDRESNWGNHMGEVWWSVSDATDLPDISEIVALAQKYHD
jgi:hypothetical protein